MSELVCRTLELLAENKDGFVSAVKNIFNTRTMATLKINDLSVGDWVYYKEGNTPYSIRSIYRTGMQDCVVLNDEKYSDGVIAFVDRLTPIPITAEMLVKNGFGKKTSTQDQLLRIVEPNGNMPFIGYRWDSRRVIIERDNDYMLRVKAEYIHQLQHVLRLAGIDKEINL